ncbi:hypothetical protein LTR16_000075 [Cryomyces antarcticus]|uniref:Uncharacterized protein n=1 Tax=Cryomyces antarcticus TaxID=329879 RepID=A0ABR0LRC1_9PEZI|nr:flavodoxin-like fold protein [Cryomyces antarcticus]KAK5202182.1 hypothetical protein LTR16_000075 [Cryomyces antarcticus]
MPKQKKLALPSKKGKKSQVQVPESADDYQELADVEETTGNKWRAGDVKKATNAYIRAIRLYIEGLQRFPQSFDLAYNKSHLQLEMTQQPRIMAVLEEHHNIPRVHFLNTTLASHRYALHLEQDSAEVMFNTAQVLTSLAEEFSEFRSRRPTEAVRLLEEATELFSSCLARQEIMYEESQSMMQMAEEEEEDTDMDLSGGAPVPPSSDPNGNVAAENDNSEDSNTPEEETVTIQQPTTVVDLIDTALAQLSTLATLCGVMSYLDEQKEPALISQLGRQLLEQRIPAYAAKLSSDELDERLEIFKQLDLTTDPKAMCAYADALVEFNDAIGELYSSHQSPDIAARRWKLLSTASSLYTAASKLDSVTDKAAIHIARGDVELLRHSLTEPPSNLSDALQASAPTLLRNAEIYYRGAGRQADADKDPRTAVEARIKESVAAHVAWLMGPGQEKAPSTPKSAVFNGFSSPQACDCIKEMVSEGLLSETWAERIATEWKLSLG